MKKAYLAVFLTCFAASAAAEYIIYPAEGQSAEQQHTDKAECQVWASENTGVDPVALASRSGPAQQEVGGERVGGAVRGALGGALIGAIAGDAGKGAAIGAGVGVVAGGAEQRETSRRNQQAVQQDSQNRAQQMDTYNRAFKVCMEGRGYTLS